MPEEVIGKVLKFFGKPMVAAIELTGGGLRVGDAVRFRGHTTDFEMTVSSIQEEHQSLEEAGAGRKVGIQVPEKAREGDLVLKLS